MRFTAIEIDNLLAYDGVSRVELPDVSPDRNIVLIWGRNGMGKTSFLTALKILFTGVEVDHHRRAGLKVGNTSERQYVMGDGANWLGLFNRRAVEVARRTGGRATARVLATWVENGRTYQAQRSWTTDGLTYTHEIVVYDGEDRLVRGAAEARLGELLPRDFVDFFFFDGEEVKELAEGIGKKSVDVDRLLGLTFVDELAKAVEEAANRRFKRNADRLVRDEIEGIEKDLARTERHRRAATDDLQDLDQQIAATSAELAHMQTWRENLAVGASGAARETLEARQATVKEQVQTAIGTIAARVPPLSPFYANMGLLREALKAVEQRLAGAGSAETTLVRAVVKSLPDWIDQADVDLRPEQRQGLVQALGERLEGLRARSVDDGLFHALNLERAESLQALLLRWSISGPAERDVQAGELEKAKQLQLELDQIADTLMRMEAGSRANLEEYKRLVTDIGKAEVQLREWHERRGQLTERVRESGEEVQRLRVRLVELYANQKQVARVAHEAEHMRAVARALREYRDARRITVKLALEQAINTRFGQLVQGHHLIEHIKLTDTYTMEFLDAGQRPIGRASLSSGLKQLAATALLWAMKDVSGRDIPVVIDTPLGRIDRENQNNLLDNYYPHISGQVIVLPTNSEIDREKLGRLDPHVARHFLIDNDKGDLGRILPDRQLVELS
ncbi:DNA sulfur modification protein DndD [Brevundimonas sp.]|uniref:DNA sulfur modification protein DndD n=1 Tax=Brevundimonas sp. TaxID=1871086 RepID=UPI003D6D8DA1